MLYKQKQMGHAVRHIEVYGMPLRLMHFGCAALIIEKPAFHV